MVGLSSGTSLVFRPASRSALAGYSPEDLNTIKISRSGLNLRFPRIKVDLYLPRLLDEFFRPEEAEIPPTRESLFT